MPTYLPKLASLTIAAMFADAARQVNPLLWGEPVVARAAQPRIRR